MYGYVKKLAIFKHSTSSYHAMLHQRQHTKIWFLSVYLVLSAGLPEEAAVSRASRSRPPAAESVSLWRTSFANRRHVSKRNTRRSLALLPVSCIASCLSGCFFFGSHTCNSSWRITSPNCASSSVCAIQYYRIGLSVLNHKYKRSQSLSARKVINWRNRSLPIDHVTWPNGLHRWHALELRPSHHKPPVNPYKACTQTCTLVYVITNIPVE